MAIASTLKLLAFPQRWTRDSATLTVRFVCLPTVSPLEPLATGVPTFADADLQFEARLIGSLEHAPRAIDSVEVGPLDLVDPPTQKAALFGELAGLIPIDPVKPSPPPRPRFRKPVTNSYRDLVGNRQLSRYLTDADEFECAVHGAHDSQPAAPITIEPHLRWGQIIALALRQPALATALGLMAETEIELPDSALYDEAGWLYIGLDPSSDGAGVAGLAESYAARIPPLGDDRDLYSAVLFPIDQPNVTLDHIYRDAERYDTGHARLVHAAQTASPDKEGDAIQLAWDDEQVAEWLNRQTDPTNAAPMGTAGYRVDVREAGTLAWQSLQKLRSTQDLQLGAVVLGSYQGEGVVEVLPTQIAPGQPGEYWMPPYFTTWRGSSLVLTDADLTRLHRRADLGLEDGNQRLRLGKDEVFEPVDEKAVPLRYGHQYEFRVRLADLSGGGFPERAALPDDGPTPDPDTHHVAPIEFRRRKRPGPVQIEQIPTRTDPLNVRVPLLGHPEILFTADAPTFAVLEDALDGDGLALPDPDVTALRIAVDVRNLVGDRVEWVRLYETERTRPANVQTLSYDVEVQDVPTVDGFPMPPNESDTLPLPSARDIRLVITALGRDEDDYWATPESNEESPRIGQSVTVEVRAKAENEVELSAGEPELRSFYFRQPPPDGSVSRPAERLATELDLNHFDLTLSGPASRRTVIGCSTNLRHTVSPERSAITFSSDADVVQQWIHALCFTIARDWTWRGLAEDGVAVYRTIKRGNQPEGARELVGTIPLPGALASNATTDVGVGVDAPERQFTDFVFFDAHDPKPLAGAEPRQFPSEHVVRYELELTVLTSQGPTAVQSDAIELPATTPPDQVPSLVSAGIALSPFEPADDYSSTTPLRSRLWFEFAEPPTDPGDAYFVRVLAVAPDPTLTQQPDVTPSEIELLEETVPEPALPIDPEWMRTIHVGQPRDDNGKFAMQSLAVRADGERYIVPLPEGVDESSPGLLSMYTYEIRVGHADERWCTAHGRWGPPLRVTGVQHPPPPLTCHVARSPRGVLVRAPFATPMLRGRHVRPRDPNTHLWALLYARVQRADGAAWRNLLLQRTQLLRPTGPPGTVVFDLIEPPVLYGEGGFGHEEVVRSLGYAGLPADAPLTALVVEVHRNPDFADPVGAELGHARLLRTSPLVPVPDVC